MKQIKELDLTKCIRANVDCTNIVPDFVFDELFDNSIYTSGSVDTLGFIDERPTIVAYIDNKITCRLIKPCSTADDLYDWGSLIIQRLTGCAVEISDCKKEQTFAFEDTIAKDSVCLYIIFTFVPSSEKISISFHYPK